MCVLCLSVMGATGQVTSFTGQSNPFNITFDSSIVTNNGTFSCFQETANETTSCGGLNSGRYYIGTGTWANQGALYDGNYSSSTIASGGSFATIFINYTKPQNVVNVTWLVKNGVNTSYYPLPLQCQNKAVIELRILGGQGATHTKYDCLDDSDALTELLDTTELSIVEEAIIWKMFDNNKSVSYKSLPIPGYQTNLTLGLKGFSSATTVKCYQEFSNVATSCGGLATGLYLAAGDPWATYANIIDGDYSTWSAKTGAFSVLYINYTKPIAAINLTWQIKDDVNWLNLSLPTQCINKSTIEFRVVLNGGGTYNCLDDNDNFVSLLTDATGAFYDEAVFWDFTNYPSNVAVLVNNYELFSTSAISSSEINVSLDTAVLNYVANQNPFNISFYSSTNGTLQINIVNDSYSYGIDNCTNSFNIPNNATALNISVLDGNAAKTYVDYASTTTYPGSSFSMENAHLNNVSLCIYPSWFNASTQTQFEYSDALGNLYSSFLTSYLNNITQLLNLYTQSNTTQVLFTVYDIDQNPLANYTIQVLKYDVGTGSYTMTESLKTDSQGHTIGNINLYNSYYNFLIYDTGLNLVLTQTGIRVTSTTYTFTVSSVTDAFYTDASNAMGVTYVLYFNNATNNVVFTWSDPANAMHLACLKVENSTYLGKTTMTDTCTNAVAGTTIYTLSLLNNDTKYYATGYLKYDYPFPLKEIQFGLENSWSFFAVDKFNSLFMAMVLILVGILIGLPNINFSMIYFIGISIVTAILGMWQLALPMIGSLCTLGLIVLYIGGKQN